MEHIIITIHGIRTNKDVPNWQDEFTSWLYKHSSLFEVHNYKYGYWMGIAPFMATLPAPFLANILRNFYVNRAKSFIRKVEKQHPDAEIHIIAHSFGTWISNELLGDSDIPISTAHLIAGVMSARIEHNSLDDYLLRKNTGRIYCHSSKGDTVCKHAPYPFGHAGYWGIIDPVVVTDKTSPRHQPYPRLPLYNRIHTGDHGDYFTEGTYNRIILDILGI